VIESALCASCSTPDPCADDRRGPRPWRPIPLDAMRRTDPNGRPLSVRDLAHLAGFSKPKLAADIRAGVLAAIRVPCGGRFIYRISYAEAQRYLRAIGVL
jgi:hypothetical protein